MGLAGDTPRYNEWIVARQIAVDGFAPDPDWVATQDPRLLDGAGNPSRAFQVPNLPGRPAKGCAVAVVAVDADGNVQVPAGVSVDVDVVEVVQFSGDYNDRAPHIMAVEDPTTPLTAWSFTLPAAIVARLPGIGGAQNQFAFRVSAAAGGPAGGEYRILVKPLGGG